MSTPHLPAVSPFILADVSIPPAITADMPVKEAIKAHYILHTLTELEQVPPTLDETIKELHDCNADGYPYLAAGAHEELLGWVQLSLYRSPRNHTGPLARNKEPSVFRTTRSPTKGGGKSVDAEGV